MSGGLYIFGTGDLAKELFYGVIEAKFQSDVELKPFKGFVTHDEDLTLEHLGQKVVQEKNLSSHLKNDDQLVLGISIPQVREKISRTFPVSFFPNLYHELSSVKPGEFTPQGNIFTAFSYLSCACDLGAHNLFNWHVSIGHDVLMGEGNVFNPGSRISGKVKLGSYNLIGANSTVLQGVTLGSLNTLGAGSVLTKNIESHQVYVGVPAREMERR